MGNDLLFTIQDGIKNTVFVVIILFLLEHVVAQLTFYVFNRKRKAFTLNFGVFVGKSIHFIRLKTSLCQLSARKVIFSWPPRIELRDVRVVYSMNLTEKTSSGKQGWKRGIPVGFFTANIVSKLCPLEIRLVNTTVVSGSRETKVDIAVLKVQYFIERDRLELTSYLHGFEERSDLKLSSLAFSFETSCQFIQNHLELNKWISSLNIDGLKYTTNSSLLAFESETSSSSTKLYKRLRQIEDFFCDMTSFTIQLENTTIILNENMHISVSNTAISLKPSFIENELVIEGSHNLAFSLNSCVFSLGEKGTLKVPIINFLFHADILSFFNEDFDLRSLSTCFTANVIDPVYSISFDQIIKILNTSKLPSENDKDAFWSRLENLTMDMKIIISNFYFVVNVTDNTQYILTLGHINSSNISDRIRNPIQETIPFVSTSNSCFLKLDEFNFSYKITREGKNVRDTLAFFNDCEFSIETHHGKLQKITGLVQFLSFTLANYEILNSLLACYQTFMINRRSKSYLSQTSQFCNIFSLHVEKLCFVFSLKGFIPLVLDTIEADSINLSNCDYDIHLLINSFTYLIEPSTVALELGTVCLKKESRKQSIVKSNEVLSTNKFLLRDNGNGMEVTLPEIKGEFDINLMWFIFVLKVSIFDHLVVHYSQGDKSSNTKYLRSVSVSNAVIVLVLPKGIDALIEMRAFNYCSVKGTVDCRSLRVLVHSVYMDKAVVYVPLLDFESVNLSSDQDYPYVISAGSIKIQTEYHFRLYKIVDNIVTFVKALKQIRVGFSDFDVFKKLYPKAEKAIRLTKVKIKVKHLLLCVNEDLFEKELGLIYKIGFAEQRERIEKLSLLQKSINETSFDDLFKEKYQVLEKHFSKSWIARYKAAKKEFHGVTSCYIERSICGYKYFTLSLDENINALKCSMTDLDVNLAPPSFPLDDCADFIYEFGDSVPLDTEYTTLLPLSINLKASIISIDIRDYPLPALFIPSCLITGDLIFTESLASLFARRSIYVPFCSLAESNYEDQDSIYGSNIIRTLTPIKTFMNLKCEVDSETPTQITWGKSLQPGYQNVMLWFDFLTKPPIDPSPKLGFWDKFRLLVHGTLQFHWKGMSQLHLNIKGSNDPYAIADIGAGLTFSWSGDTKLTINDNKCTKTFLKINSNNFQLGVRDFSTPDSFDKLIMKLRGEVRWTMGLRFESGDVDSIGFSPRTADLKPHYDVELSHPNYIADLSTHDSYFGFRSNFIHMAFGVHSENSKIGSNSIHLASETFAHFLSWWRLFNTFTAGPIRQGSLFPDLSQNGKKFGKCLFTIKYQLCLQPLRITHIHRHPYSNSNTKEYNNLAFTGLKASIGSLKLDLHQKRKKIILQNEILQISESKWKFEINIGELDFSNADIRVLFALFEQKAIEGLLEKSLGISHDKNNVPKKYGLDDSYLNNIDWFDKDDYSDLHQIPLESDIPIKFSVLPFIYAPKITYFRDVHNKGMSLRYEFGSEDVHECILGKTHPDLTQKILIKERAVQLMEQKQAVENRIRYLYGLLDARNASLTTDENEELIFLKETSDYLNYSLLLINEILQDFGTSDSGTTECGKSDFKMHETVSHSNFGVGIGFQSCQMNTKNSFKNNQTFTTLSNESTFDNRFIFHNVLIKINKEIRDHLLSYVDSITMRSLSHFFAKHKAIMLLDELFKNRFQKTFIMEPKFEQRNDSTNLSNTDILAIFQDFVRRVADGFEPLDNYSVRLISPQIQITSEKELSKAILIASRDVELSIIDIHATGVEEEKYKDENNALMETRYCFTFSDSQFFILDEKNTAKWHELSAYLNSYSTDSFSEMSTFQLPLEACYTSEFLQEHLFLQKNDIFIIFSRPNSLFFNEQKNSSNHGEPRVHIGFPKLRLTSTSEQYSAIFNIIKDMVSFSSSKEKKMDKLARVFLAEEVKSNIGKLDNKLVESLQMKIRALKYLDSFVRFHNSQTYQESSQAILIELHTTKLALYLLMSAIKQNYDRLKMKNKSKLFNRLSWEISGDELVWELSDEDKKSFVVFGVGPFNYRRSESYYGSTNNKLDISTLQCFNMQENCIYRELLGPYEHHPKFDSSKSFINISWNMGAPTGGISNLTKLTFEAQPIIFKMDYRTSEKLMAFLFPKSRPSETLTMGTDELKNTTHRTRCSNTKTHQQPAKDMNDLSVSSSLASKMGLTEWDAESFTKILQRVNWRQNTKTIQAPNSDMNEMLLRSSKYFTVDDVVIKNLILSVSYKGSRSVITNVDNLIVKVPTIEYRNKLWSTEEFISSLRKDIVRIVLQHTGYIIGNKFVPHKRETKNEPLRQLTTVIKPELKLFQKASTSSLKEDSINSINQSSEPTPQL